MDEELCDHSCSLQTSASCYFILCDVMWCDVMLCYVILCYVLLCYIMLYDTIYCVWQLYLMRFLLSCHTSDHQITSLLLSHYIVVWISPIIAYTPPLPYRLSFNHINMHMHLSTSPLHSSPFNRLSTLLFPVGQRYFSRDRSGPHGRLPLDRWTV